MNALTIRGMNGASIAVSEEAVLVKQKLLTASKTLEIVWDSPTQSLAVEHMKDLKGMSKSVEKVRKEIKEPIIELARQIDAAAKNFTGDLDAEYNRLQALVNKFQSVCAEREEKLRKEALQAQRQAELKLLEEQKALEKKAEGAIGQRKLDLSAKAEALEIENKAKAEALRQEAERKLAIAAPVKSTGLTVSKVPRYEVVNLTALYSARPDLCKLEESASKINEAIRGGAKDVPGLKIWWETQSTVRT